MKHARAVLALLLVFSGCSRALSHDQAQKLIESNPLINAAGDRITVQGISSTSDAEAIVRATILGQTANLRFRRFDTGWKWEFVETKGGGWIPPEEGLKQIREVDRQSRVAQWVAANQDAYKKSIAAINSLCGDNFLPHRTDSRFTVAEWYKDRKSWATLMKKLGSVSVEPGYDESMARPPAAKDAWGSDVSIDFDEGKRQAFFFSSGADKKFGTGDDILCQAKGRKAYEDSLETVVWTYDLRWVIPEGLDALLLPYADKMVGKPEHTTVMK